MNLFFKIIKISIFGLIFSININYLNASLFDLGFGQKSESSKDKELKKLISFYDSETKGLKEQKKYEDVIEQAYSILIDNYVYEINNDKKKVIVNDAINSIIKEKKAILPENKKDTAKILAYSALRVIYSELDPHTSFMNPDDTQMLKSNIDGEYDGVGIILGAEKGSDYIRALDVIDKGPAEKAGVKPGDFIIKINNKKYTAKQLDIVSNLLKGKRGTKVTITVKRGGVLKNITITRNKVNLDTVYYELLDNKYAYIRIATFNYNTSAQFREALRNLNINKTKGVILDLRNNPGGLLYSSLIISDMFIDDGLLLKVKGRNADYDMNYFASKANEVNKNIPVVVLVNNMTASAAEIVTAALEQNNRAVIMGQTTFGKGSVQTIYDLKDGSSVKLTIQLFYTPNGNALQSLGVTPSIFINPIKKSSYYNIHEKSYKNYLTIPNQQPNKEPTKFINEASCKPYTKWEDKEIGCAVDYLVKK